MAREPWLVRRLGLDTAAGRVLLGLGLGGLVASGLAAAAALLVASLAVTAAGSAWDDSPAGEAGGWPGRRGPWPGCRCRSRWW